MVFSTAEEGHSVAESFYFVLCLKTQLCRPYDANQLFEVSNALSLVLYFVHECIN